VTERTPADKVDTLDLAVQGGVSLIPHVGGFLQVFAAWESQRFKERAAELEERLAEEVTVEELERALADERRSRSIIRAATINSLTDWEDKRQVLASVVRAVVAGDDAELDDAELLVDALEDLDRPHIALLVRIYEEQEATGETVRIYYLDPEPHPSAVSGLIRHGLVSSEGTGLTLGGITRCSVTTFGEDLLRLLGHEIPEHDEEAGDENVDGVEP
jgi:hypothetical protein